VVIDRIRRGTHDRADANGPCRGCATAVSFRAASRTSHRACPCPVLLCTLHIGGANLKSRATCDSTVLPVAHGRPLALGSVGLRDTSGSLLHAASGSHSSRSGLFISIRSQRLPRACTHGPAEAAFLDASLLLPAGRVHPVRMALGACSLQAHQPSRVGRQRPPGASKLRASTGTRVYHPNMPDAARTFCAQSKPIPIRDQCQLEVGWARVARAVRLAPTTSLHFSRSNAWGRSDLHRPHDAWTSQTHKGPGMLQDRRGMAA